MHNFSGKLKYEGRSNENYLFLVCIFFSVMSNQSWRSLSSDSFSSISFILLQQKRALLFKYPNFFFFCFVAVRQFNDICFSVLVWFHQVRNPCDTRRGRFFRMQLECYEICIGLLRPDRICKRTLMSWQRRQQQERLKSAYLTSKTNDFCTPRTPSFYVPHSDTFFTVLCSTTACREQVWSPVGQNVRENCNFFPICCSYSCHLIFDS